MLALHVQGRQQEEVKVCRCGLFQFGRGACAEKPFLAGEPVRAFEGSRSRPNALMLTVATAMLQTAKKSQPASENRESLIMTQDPPGARLPESNLAPA
jgi:hypothetical protein